MASKRHLSGIQPSGLLHLGNYFGAIRKHIANQDDAYYFIADYHALTTVRDPAVLQQNVFDAALTYLALGLDPERAVLFRQSDVPEVTELTWLLMTTTGMGLIERAHSFKDKVARGISPSMGLFCYPVLMAADILAYDAEIVPVGKDQVQHLEMTRDMATSFNAVYGDVFVLPKVVLGTPEPVPGIDGEKMSKSYGNTIPVFAKGKALKKLVMSIKTDSTPLEDPKDPSTCTVFELFSLFADDAAKAELAAKYRGGNFGYGHAKLALLEEMKRYFAEAHARKEALEKDPAQVEAILQAGAAKARAKAQAVLHRARVACGLSR
jgi:tryptophanyl-tRNA synthetase